MGFNASKYENPQAEARATEKLIQRLRGGRAARDYPCASVPQEKSGRGRRRRSEIGRRGLEGDIAARRVDRCRSGRAIGLGSISRNGNALRGRRTSGRRSRASVADKYIGDAIRVAIYQIHRGRKECHVAPVRADRGRNTVAIGGVAAHSDGCERVGRSASGGRAQASIADKDILRCSRDFGDAVHGSQ